jgi:hypothetical protein
MFKRLNQGIIKLGDGEDGTVKSVTGYLVGVREKADKKSSNVILLQSDRPPHEPMEMYSSTIVDRCVLNKDEDAIAPLLLNKLVRFTFEGAGKKKRGRNAVKLVAVEVDSSKTLPKGKVVPF